MSRFVCLIILVAAAALVPSASARPEAPPRLALVRLDRCAGYVVQAVSAAGDRAILRSPHLECPPPSG